MLTKRKALAVMIVVAAAFGIGLTFLPIGAQPNAKDDIKVPPNPIKFLLKKLDAVRDQIDPLDPACYDNTNRYVDCSNGTVTDTVTDLTWTMDAGCIGLMTYAEANEAAAALADGQCGLTDNSKPGDWRLPTLTEWEATITRAVELGCTLATGPSLTNTPGTGCFADGPQPFDNVDAAGTALYWSATSVSEDPTKAWEFNINGTVTANTPKINFVQGWAVRTN